MRSWWRSRSALTQQQIRTIILTTLIVAAGELAIALLWGHF